MQWNFNETILYSGYNEIGLKIFINGTEKKTGFIKFRPLMFHTGGISHTTPVSENFYYDEQKSLFSGYVCLLMASDSSTSFWFADYNYNDEKIIRLNQFSVFRAKDFQMRFFYDTNTKISYSLALITPKNNPVMGINEFKCILHRRDTNDFYREVDSAEMFIRIWKIQINNMILGNLNPVWIGGGKYLGSVDFPGSGLWNVNDSIIYRGYTITGNPLVNLIFDVH